MAGIYDDPDELRRFAEAFYESAERFRSGLNDADDAVRSSSRKKTKLDQEYEAQLKKNSAAFANATDAVTNFAKQVSSGQATTALNNGLLSIAGKLSEKGPLGVALNTLTKLYVHAAAEFDKLFGTFKAISESGVVATVTDITNTMNKLGLSMELTQQILTRNSTALSKFAGSALNGRKMFEDLAEEVRDMRESFLNLGVTATDFNDYQIQYMEMLQINGRLDKMQGDQFRVGLRDYVVELDVLAKLTGKQRKAIADEMKARETDLTFRLAVRGKDPKQAAELNAMLSLIKAKMGDGVEQAVKAGIVGKMSDPALQSMLIGVPNFLDFVKQIEAGGDVAVNALNEMAGQAKTFSDTMPKELVSNLKDGNKTVLATTVGLISGNNATIVSIEELREAINKLEGGADKTTANLAKKENAELKAAQNIQNLTLSFTGLTDIMAAFAKAVERATGFLNRLFGGNNQVSQAVNMPGPTTGAAAATGAARGAATSASVAQTGNSYLDKVIGVESGGRNIPNQSGPGGAPTSTAYGIAQMTSGTFNTLAKNVSPGNPLFGKTFEDMKTDVALQIEAAKQLTEANKKSLAAAGLGTSDAALYLAHFLGAGGAIKVLKASNNAPLSSAVTAEQFSANPFLKEMTTVGDIKSWAQKKMGDQTQLAMGGIASGPVSGYSATLHGNEMIQPLDKNSILQKLAITPASVSESTNMLNNRELVDETHAMTRKYDEMIKVLGDIRNIQRTLMMRTYA